MDKRKTTKRGSELTNSDPYPGTSRSSTVESHDGFEDDESLQSSIGNEYSTTEDVEQEGEQTMEHIVGVHKLNPNLFPSQSFDPKKFEIELNKITKNEVVSGEYGCDGRKHHLSKSGRKFQLFAFCKREAENEDPLLKELGIVLPSTRIATYIIVVQHEDYPLYALSKGTAWQTINRFVDYKFPSLAAAKLMERDGVQRYRVTPIFGSVAGITATLKKKKSLGELDVGDVVKGFSGYVREDLVDKLFPVRPKQQKADTKVLKEASDAALDTNVDHLGKVMKKMTMSEPCSDEVDKPLKLTTKGKKPSPVDKPAQRTSEVLPKATRRVPMHVLLGSVKFGVGLCLGDYLTLIEELESGPQDIDDEAFADCKNILRCLTPLDLETSRVLTTELSTLIETTKVVPEGLEVCPSKYADYFESSNIRFTHQGKSTIVTFDPNRVLAALLQDILPRERTQDGLLTDKIYLRYDINRKTNGMKLSQALRGTFRSPNMNQTFFLVGTWYAVTEEFHIRTQEKFQAILKECLLPHVDPDDKGLHLNRWKHEMKTEWIYNCSHEDNPDIMIGDHVLYKNVELFDLLKVDGTGTSTNSFVCHVKKSVGEYQGASYACNQLMRSAAIMKGSSFATLTEDDLQEILLVYRENVESTVHKNRFRPTATITEANFLRFLGSDDPKSAKFVLTLLLNDNLCVPVDTEVSSSFDNMKDRIAKRSLHHEKHVSLNLTKNDIIDQLNEPANGELKLLLARELRCSPNEVTSHLLDKLVEHKFLKKPVHNDSYKVTSKLLLQPSHEKLDSICSAQDKLSLLLQRYQTFYKSLGFKLDVITTYNAVDDGQFKIFEILRDGPKPKQEKKQDDNKPTEKKRSVKKEPPTSKTKSAGKKIPTDKKTPAEKK